MSDKNKMYLAYAWMELVWLGSLTVTCWTCNPEVTQRRRSDSASWSRSVKTGVWVRALGNGDQCRPMGHKAREGLYIFYVLTGARELEHKVLGFSFLGNHWQRYGVSAAVWDHVQHYLLPNTNKCNCAPSLPQPDRPALDLPALLGCQAELTLMLVSG